MGILLFVFLVSYFSLFQFLILTYLWAIPINILIAILLDAITIFLIILIMLPICKHTKVDNRFKHAYIRSLLRVGLFFINVHPKYEGLDNIPDGPFVLFPNHKSYVDILVLFTMLRRPTAFISKPENFNIPLVGKYMETIGCLALNRESDREAAVSIINGIKLIKSGMSMVIFPEGGIKSRTDEHMMDIKAGAYKLAMKPKVPVIPVTLVGMTKIKERAPLRRTNVKCIIHKPILCDEYENLNTHELGEKVFEIVNSAL